MKLQGLLYICFLHFVAALQISLPSMTTQSTQPPLWDAHAHLQLNLEDADIELTKLPLGHRVGLMSVEESCWDRIASLLDGPHASKLRGAYGIHPWFAHHVPMNDSTWLVKLQARLMADSSAIVGEIGLDAQWVPPPVAHPPPRRFGRKRVEWAAQERIFREQLILAAELGRPVSVHCVQSAGAIQDIFLGRLCKQPRKGKGPPRGSIRAAAEAAAASVDELPGHEGKVVVLNSAAAAAAVVGHDSDNDDSDDDDDDDESAEQRVSLVQKLPPAIYMHSFGGSPGMVASLLALERKKGKTMKRGRSAAIDQNETPPVFYFGFSHAVNSRSPKTPAVIAAVPDNRLLLESDLERSSWSKLNDNTPINLSRREEYLAAMVACIAAAKGWTTEETRQRTFENAERFYATRRAPQ